MARSMVASVLSSHDHHTDRSSAILKAASDLFSRYGYTGVRMTDVAEAIGVTKPVVYKFYDNKDALFRAVVLQSLEPQRKAAALLAEGPAQSPRDMLPLILSVAAEHIKTPAALSTYRVALSEAQRHPELKEFLQTQFTQPIYGALGIYFQKLMDQGQVKPAEPAILARLFLAPLQTVLMGYMANGVDYPLPYDLTAFLETHLSGFFATWMVD